MSVDYTRIHPYYEFQKTLLGLLLISKSCLVFSPGPPNLIGLGKVKDGLNIVMIPSSNVCTFRVLVVSLMT